MYRIINFAFLILISSVPTHSSQLLSEQAKEQSAASDNKAVVYIYRYKQFEGYIVEPSVYCDGGELARMDNGRYFKVLQNPGKHIFRSNDKQSGIEIDLKAGQEYYIRVEITTGLFKQRGRVVLMSNEQGAYEIKNLKLLDAGKVKDRSKVVTEENQKKQRQPR